MMYRILIIILLYSLFSSASDNKRKAMGNIQLASPDRESQINLFQRAGNNAGLITNDSLNWMKIKTGSLNENGTNRRYWDARRLQYNSISYQGQKHLSADMAFYGEMQYIWDNRYGVNQAIEKEPYAPDPFVLSDSTSGNFSHSGPKISIVFNQQLTPEFYYGIGLDYCINNGLKNKFTRPEIISRNIALSVDFIYKISPAMSLGLSFKPYQNLDDTKIVTQPDETTPVTYSYRGEYEFRKRISSFDRTAEYTGYELVFPQLSLAGKRLESIIFTVYGYRQTDISDKIFTTRYKEGYHQGEYYFGCLTSRYYLNHERQTSLAVDYCYKYFKDWASEPKNKLLLYESFMTQHEILLGFAHKTNRFLEIAAEGYYRTYNPDKKDYLAKIYRNGNIKLFGVRGGINYNINSVLALRTGIEYQSHHEAEIWDYFGDYKGLTGSAGFGFYGHAFELEGYFSYGKMTRKEPVLYLKSTRYRENLDIELQLKSYF
ncbi:MAG: hypothetical protein JXR46_05005 [Calditrichaceae bacterium]|nr:hypothetical protein [Calditrichaceae bacterium]MBN2708387.1 hypothetical protein [Calditrichaceae bacterium]